MADTAKTTSSKTKVTVCSCLPSDHEFNIWNGKTVAKVITIKGTKPSKFVGLNGQPMENGNQFSETIIDSDDWAYIEKNYGDMVMMKNKVIFAEDKDPKAAKKEKKEVRSGFEQIDPKKTKNTKPLEKDE